MPWINNGAIRQREELAANSPDQSGMISAGKIGSPNAAAKKNIAAKNSDLFDVLAFVAFALPPVTRQARADQAKT